MVELLEEAQRRGRIRWFGFSFHDSFSAFEEILRARSWDLCQIQLNYMDTEHQAGLRGYALAEALGIPVVVMEPVKGGPWPSCQMTPALPLLRLDPEATPASWALRWAASLPHVQVVLSGMGSMEQLEDNLHTFQDFRPLDLREREAVTETAERLRRRLKNGCTGCGYCMPCPAGVDIPGSFQIWNRMSMYQNREITRRQWEGLDQEERPDLCHRCGQCERRCPQHLRIRAQLAQVTGDVARFLRGSRTAQSQFDSSPVPCDRFINDTAIHTERVRIRAPSQSVAKAAQPLLRQSLFTSSQQETHHHRQHQDMDWIEQIAGRLHPAAVVPLAAPVEPDGDQSQKGKALLGNSTVSPRILTWSTRPANSPQLIQIIPAAWPRRCHQRPPRNR